MTTRVAVTGASGFIGRHLTSHLVAHGFDVRVIQRPETIGLPTTGVAGVRAPLLESALADAFAGADAVIHLAGVTSALRQETYARANIEGTREVARAARAAGAWLVQISSLAAAGPARAAAPRGEDDSPEPITPYGRSKLAGEIVVRETGGLHWTILRPAAVYGPADRALLPLFRLAELGLLPLVGRQGAAYTLVYVTDLVRAIEAAVRARDDRAVIFVGHPRAVGARELLEQIRAAVGRPARIVRLPLPAARAAAALCDVAGRAAGRPFSFNRARLAEMCAEGFVCRVDQLRERLGIVAKIDLAEGLAATADWYRREGWLRQGAA